MRTLRQLLKILKKANFLNIFLCFILLANNCAHAQLVSEYHFYGLSSGTLQIDSVNNSTVQNSYYTPVGMNGVAFSVNEPSFLANGVLIEHNKYLVSDGSHDSTTDYYHMFEIWIYYIQGNLGNFVNIDWTFLAPNIGSFILSTTSSGGNQYVNQIFTSTYQLTQPLVTGWNLIMFGGSKTYTDFINNICKYGTNGASYSSPGGKYTGNSQNGVRKLGGYDCSDTTVQYLIYSFSFQQGLTGWSSSSLYSTAIPTNPNYGATSVGGNSVVESAEECDDGGTTSGDGCDSTCIVEAGYQGTSSSPSICSDYGGDGLNYTPAVSGYGDDGNIVNGDGCSSTCSVESGFSGGGGSTSAADTGIDIGGDGKLVTSRTPATYGDDGNIINNDGGSSTGSTEDGYTGSGATTTTADTCTSLCGNGLRTATESCDDGNVMSGDGCSSACAIESGYSGTGGSSSSADTCTDIGGDGKVVGTRSPSTYGDDGNGVNGDGCSSACATEANYVGSGGSSTTADTGTPICGDGKRIGTESGDDSKISSGDGCSSSCTVESGFSGTGGSSTAADVCSDIGADGKLVTSRSPSKYCDDGNSVNGDGCNSAGSTETGFTGSGATTSLADTGTPIGGDSKKLGSEACEDGNTINGDGGSSTCAVELGYSGSGGTSTSIDTCIDICADGKLVTSRTPSTYCDDGNSINGDGCSSTCSTETGYSGSGATTTTADTGTPIGGDGKRIGTEAGDDSNVFSSDGCSSSCVVEAGYTCSGGSSTTSDTCADLCGDGKLMTSRSPSTYCDDGNSINGDGCSSTCSTEIGYLGSGATTTTADTGTPIGGDGIRIGIEACDDGNVFSSDGCSSSCVVESGYICSGGSSTTSDTCTDLCGDGKLMTSRSPSTYGDDGNNISGDGGSSTGATESGYSCSGATTSTADTCIDVGGDGFVKMRNTGTYCDDGNTVSNDGCSNSCNIETGYAGTGGSATRSDTCSPICGDGIWFSASEECDDGNSNSQDGGSSTCKNETGFIGTSNTSNNPATTCNEVGGDGIRYAAQCDDGNTVSGDGGSSIGTTESGYTGFGGSSNSPDVCMIIGGDGIISSSSTLDGDDGNTVDGDGCSSECLIEDGYSGTSTSPSIGTETCGDGRRKSLTGCDDGNIIDGDGGSSTGTIETGFTCSGGSITKKDAGTEICGDGFDYGENEGEDGNLIDGDGGSSTCEYETGYEGYGGTPTSIDTGYILQISASIISHSINNIKVEFDHIMQTNSISKDDLMIEIQANEALSFDWSASYINTTTFNIDLSINKVLIGNEILTMSFINYKIFRGPNGGCVITDSLSTYLGNSLEGSIKSAKSIGNYIQYIVLGGIICGVLLIMAFEGSIELIWSLINTLQIITYLPLMTPFYPEHVKVMFSVLEFVNMDISFIASMFNFLFGFGNIGTPSYDARFLNNGIDSPLFLENCASIVMSFLLTILTIIALSTMYGIFRCDKIRPKLLALINSYFWNNILRFFTEGYLEITFGALLNVVAFPIGNSAEVASLLISGIAGFFLIIYPFMVATLLYDKRKQIKNENETYLKRFGTMYKDFRINGKWYTFQYYSVFLIRRLIFIIFLIVLIEYPQMQCNSFIFGSYLMFSYQIGAKPFKEEIINIICCINEFTLGCISILQIIFVTDMNDYNTVNYTGWVLISLMIVIVMINFFVILTYSVKHKMALNKARRRKQKEERKIDKIADTTHIESMVASHHHIAPIKSTRAFAQTSTRIIYTGPKTFNEIQFN